MCDALQGVEKGWTRHCNFHIHGSLSATRCCLQSAHPRQNTQKQSNKYKHARTNSDLIICVFKHMHTAHTRTRAHMRTRRHATQTSTASAAKNMTLSPRQKGARLKWYPLINSVPSMQSSREDACTPSSPAAALLVWWWWARTHTHIDAELQRHSSPSQRQTDTHTRARTRTHAHGSP